MHRHCLLWAVALLTGAFLVACPGPAEEAPDPCLNASGDNCEVPVSSSNQDAGVAIDSGVSDAGVAETSACTVDDDCNEGACVDGHCAPVCLDEGEECWLANCCEGLVCLGDENVYIAPLCSRPLEDGAFCVSDASCASGACVDGACAASCVVEGATCSTEGSPCCTGFCLDFAYGTGECTPLLETGAFCTGDNECNTGACVDGACVEPL